MTRSVSGGRPFKIQETTLICSAHFPLAYNMSLKKKNVRVQYLLSRYCLLLLLKSSLEIEVGV